MDHRLTHLHFRSLRYRFAVISLCFLFSGLANAASSAPNEVSPGSLKATNHATSSVGFLPSSFAGWELSGTPQLGSDPRKLDTTSSSVLLEDRFTGYELATYKREDRTLTIKAARFADAAGAYAAFTFYRQPLMRPEEVGLLAVSLNDRVLFLSGNLVVDAQFDHVTAMSGAQMRELAADLPRVSGPAAALPTLPDYLPRKEMVPETARYLIGPAAYSQLNIDLSPGLIDFSKSPELLWAKIDGEAPGSAEILLIAYPTPHIAMAQLPALEQLAPPAGETSVARRSGPILALVRGNISHRDAAHLLDGINYDANVTWNENTGQGKRDNIGELIIAALTLAGILVVISIGAGAVFGLGRFLLPRIRAKAGGDNPDNGEMIRLDLHS